MGTSDISQSVMGFMTLDHVEVLQKCTQYPSFCWGQDISEEPGEYRQVFNIRCTESQNLKCFSFWLAVVFVQYIKARCEAENEDVVGAAPTGEAPTTSEWSTT